MKRVKINFQKGFTLIELLIVIGIVGTLSTIVLSSLNSARIKARDANRKVEIKQIQASLELYYNDHGNYPIGGWYSSTNTSVWSTFGNTLGVKLPIDPLNIGSHAYSSGTYTYSYYGNSYGCPGQWYMLVYRLEGTSNPISPGVKSCTSTFNYSGTVTVGANSLM